MQESRRKILVVDDEETSVEFVAAVIEGMGDYDVLKAADGEQAVNTARQEIPALIVMDVNMPKKDGYTAFTELQQDDATSGIPVIMLSSLASFGEYVSLNPDVRKPRLFLDKPITPEALAQMIDRVLAQ